ncbi:MAG: HAMP domain-containing sensor histidine kinase [Pseudomonadota bacterium]
MAAGFVYFGTRAELRDALNAQSDILALTIAGLEGDTISRASFGQGLERYGQDYLIRVWDAEGNLLVDSNENLHGLLNTAALETVPSTLDEGWDIREYTLGSGERVLIARLEQEADELVWQVAFTSLVPMALALLGAILTATLLVRQGLTPLTSLSRELTQRSASDLRQLPASDAPDELEPIIGEMNALLARIETSLKRERRFVDDAAHELRTPLSIIKAQCQAIDLDALDADTRSRLQNITQGVDRMAALSSQLLDQARAGQTESPAQEIQVTPLVAEICATLAPEAETRSVTIEIIEKASPVYVGSAEDLRTIFRNILENALKFAGSPGRVHVTLSQTCIEIEDSGEGVPEAIRDQIFDRFFQLRKSSGGGAGLGLSIVNAIAERSGLDITVHDSESLKGACFRVVWASPV